MFRYVRAKYSDGVLTPLEPLDLDEGAEVGLSVQPLRRPLPSPEEIVAAAGGWVGLGDWEAFKDMIYESRLAGSRPRPERWNRDLTGGC